MNSVNKGVIASTQKVRAGFSLSKHLLEGSSWRELRDIEGDAIVGCFNYGGRSVLYVVNYSRERGQRITLDFHDVCDLKLTRQGALSAQRAGTLILDMNPGEGVLIEIN